MICLVQELCRRWYKYHKRSELHKRKRKGKEEKNKMNLQNMLEKEYENVLAEDTSILKTQETNEIYLLNKYLTWNEEEKNKGTVEQTFKTLFNLFLNDSFNRETITKISILKDPKGKDLSSICGFFYSALIYLDYQKTKTTEPYVLITTDKTILPERIGFANNGAKINVIGSAGLCAAQQMSAGELNISEDALHSIGIDMTGGTVSVKGNCEGMTGAFLKGGEIIIHGKSGEETGYGMNNGIITVFGSCADKLGRNMFNGRINVHGRINGTVGVNMRDGEIYAYKNIPHISDSIYADGKIFFRGERIH